MPVEPQPGVGDVLFVRRYYISLTASNQYRKRVIWLEKTPDCLDSQVTEKSLVEYTADYPGLAPHGNARILSVPYMRTSAKVIAQIDKNLYTPKEVYKDKTESSEITMAPRDVQQIKNRK